MSFSFVRIILDSTEKAVYERGFKYANQEKIKIIEQGNNYCKANVFGQETYQVELGFKRTGSPKFSCTCKYFELNKSTCKHIIAAALVWDRSRKVPDPEMETVEQSCIPEPDFTSKDINQAYRDPINANLDILRADPTGWMRPHANLPKAPNICQDKLTNVGQVKTGISELRSWTRKYKYDTYFCAGEMMAGFCELIRWVTTSIDNFGLNDKLIIATLLSSFHHELILERIDDSDGIHIFSEAQLENLLKIISKDDLGKKGEPELLKIKNQIYNY